MIRPILTVPCAFAAECAPAAIAIAPKPISSLRIEILPKLVLRTTVIAAIHQVNFIADHGQSAHRTMRQKRKRDHRDLGTGAKLAQCLRPWAAARANDPAQNLNRVCAAHLPARAHKASYFRPIRHVIAIALHPGRRTMLNRVTLGLIAALCLAAFGPAAHAQPVGGAEPRIEWEVKNRFRLFRSDADFRRHVAAAQRQRAGRPRQLWRRTATAAAGRATRSNGYASIAPAACSKPASATASGNPI